MKVSVAMASYNGEKFIGSQIESILKNLKDNDELIISDDGSTDNTIKIINDFIKKDGRIKLVEGPHKKIKDNFENAVKNTTGDYIFLADQDDIWMNNKVELVLTKFNENNDINVIVHDNIVIDSNLKQIYSSLFKYRNSGKGVLKNIYKNTYIGCCMAIRGSFKKNILPFPEKIHMHDQWIGVVGDLYKSSMFINDKLIYYRRHGENNSSFNHSKLSEMIKNRLFFIKNILKYKYERMIKK